MVNTSCVRMNECNATIMGEEAQSSVRMKGVDSASTLTCRMRVGWEDGVGSREANEAIEVSAAMNSRAAMGILVYGEVSCTDQYEP